MFSVNPLSLRRCFLAVTNNVICTHKKRKIGNKKDKCKVVQMKKYIFFGVKLGL